MKTFWLIFICCVVPISLYSQWSSEPEPNSTQEFLKFEKFNFNIQEIEKKLNDPTYIKYDEITKELQTLQTAQNTNVSNMTLPESEIHAAINPTDSNNMVISPIQQSSSNPLLRLTCPVYYTKDFGKTWKQSEFVTKPSRANISVLGGGDPVFAFDANGKLYMSWIDLFATYKTGSTTTIDSMFAALFWASSTDGGATWEFKDEYIGPSIGKSKYSYGGGLDLMIDKQWMAVDRTNSKYRNQLYVSGLAFKSSGTTEFYVYRKPANSDVFIRQGTLINTTQFTEIQFGSIVVDKNSYVHFTFYGKNVSTKPALYHCVSKDGGVTFSNPTLISYYAGISDASGKQTITGISSQRLYPSPYLAVDNSSSEFSGNLYISWSSWGLESKGNNGIEVYLARSTDGGANWQKPVVVNNNSTPSSHNFYPTINVNPNGVVLVSWYDRRYDAANVNTDLFLGLSFDGGLSFTNKLVTDVMSNFATIGSLNSNFGIGEYNGLVSTGGYAIPVWADGRKNNGDIDVYSAIVKIDNIEEGRTDVESIIPINTDFHLAEVTPNPSVNDIKINIDNFKTAKFNIEVMDLEGKTVLNLFDGMIDETNFSLSSEVNKLTNGAYLLKVSNDNTFSIRKFVVNK